MCHYTAPTHTTDADGGHTGTHTGAHMVIVPTLPDLHRLRSMIASHTSLLAIDATHRFLLLRAPSAMQRAQAMRIVAELHALAGVPLPSEDDVLVLPVPSATWEGLLLAACCPDGDAFGQAWRALSDEERARAWDASQDEQHEHAPCALHVIKAEMELEYDKLLDPDLASDSDGDC